MNLSQTRERDFSFMLVINCCFYNDFELTQLSQSQAEAVQVLRLQLRERLVCVL